jgi:SAM-dependent methyltransferase
MTRLLRRIPGVMAIYRQARLLADVAYDRWLADPARVNDRSHLTGEWDFKAPLEQERHARMLAMVERHRGSGGWGDALELGCSEGLFTVQLARHAARLLAVDISPLACARTAERCAAIRNVSVERLDLARDPLPGRYDLILAMGIFECVHGCDRLAHVTRKVVAALKPCGLLAATVARLPEGLRHGWWVRWFPEGADCIVPILSSGFGLRLLEQAPQRGITTSGAVVDHVVALFEKDPEPTQ